MERDPYRLWEVLGTWASGIGSLAAVVTSLWLARRSGRPNVLAEADIKLVLNPSEHRGRDDVTVADLPEFLIIEVVNASELPVCITSVGWHWALIRSPGAMQNGPERQFGPGLPCTLAHGAPLHWMLEYASIVESLAAHMVAPIWWWRLKLRFMRLNVGTSTGHVFKGRIGKTLRNALAAKAREIRAANPRT